MALRRLVTEAEHIDRYFFSNILIKTLMNTYQIVYIHTKEDNNNEIKITSCKEENFGITSYRIGRVVKEYEDGLDNLMLTLTNDDLRKNIEAEKTYNNRLLSSKQSYNRNKEYVKLLKTV
jgi:hypothetical protein